MTPHKFTVRIYVEDTDYTGVVYHPNYLKYIERARLDWFESNGFSLSQQQRYGLLYVVHCIDIKYSKPAYIDDQLVISTTIRVIGKAKTRLRFHQEIDNLTQQQHKTVSATIDVVCVNQQIKPQPIPTTILETIND